MSYKVLVTGSRRLTNWQKVYDELQTILHEHYPLTVIHGAADGADTFADIWATAMPNVHVVRVPADWANNGGAAGPMRNSAMLELGPDLVVAFFHSEGKSVGTQNMVDQARNAGVPVDVHYTT